MIHIYKNININYKVIGNGKTQIVFLHGWGGSIASFEYICNYLPDTTCLIIDFPPFGESQEPRQPFTIFDYAELTLEIMRENDFVKPIIVGHSFGGRVAIILACGNFTSKLVLTASAGLKPKRSLKYYFKVVKNKICKKIGLKISGSKDYNALSPIMKKTFVNIVTTFLEKYAINITVPTLLFWGKKDKETPKYMAKRFNKLIKPSHLVLVKGGHFAYIEQSNTFVHVLKYFIFHM